MVLVVIQKHFQKKKNIRNENKKTLDKRSLKEELEVMGGTITPAAGAREVINPINGKEYLLTGSDKKFQDEFGEKVYVRVIYKVEHRKVEVTHDGCRSGPGPMGSGDYTMEQIVTDNKFYEVSNKEFIANWDGLIILWEIC